MSIELVKEVLYNCPNDLDGTARLLLLVLAEMAQDKDRRDSRGRLIPARTCWPKQEQLMKLTGIKSARGLELVYERLGRLGLDPRVPLGTDKTGRPIYANRGVKATTFKVPVMPSALDKGRIEVRALHEKGRTEVRAFSEKGRTAVPERANSSSRKGEPEFAPNHKEPQVTLPPTPKPDRTDRAPSSGNRGGEDDLILQELTDRGLGPDEARAVLDYARSDPETVSPRKRLQQSTYLTKCRASVKADRARSYSAGARCLDHPAEVATNCRSCNADVKVGERDRRFIGKHQPQCSKCLDPLIGYPDLANTCHDCADTVVPA